MTDQIIYVSDSLRAIFDSDLDEVCIIDMVSYEQNNIPYFTFEEIMENARKAHVMRNNLRLREDDLDVYSE